MRQLVGMICVHCRQRIPSVIDGRFCLSCGCPVHNDCVPSPVIAPEGGCRVCGASAADASANAAGAAQDARDRAAAPKPWDAVGYAPFDGVGEEWRWLRRLWVGVALCIGGLAYVGRRIGDADGGTALIAGGGMFALGGAYLYFAIRRLNAGNKAPPE